MGSVILGMTMSLDGYINDRHGSVERLYPDLPDLRHQEALQESIQNTGAVLMGRHAFEMGEPDAYAESYEYQVPIFVLTHQPPQRHPRETDQLTFTFITDGIESAVAQAKAAAGAKDVTVIGGASTFQQILRAGLADEIHIDIRPVLFGGGQRLFENLADAPITLEKTRIIDAPTRTHLRFSVIGRA